MCLKQIFIGTAKLGVTKIWLALPPNAPRGYGSAETQLLFDLHIPIQNSGYEPLHKQFIFEKFCSY